MPTSSILGLAPSENSSQHMTELVLKYQQFPFEYGLPILAKNVDTLHTFYLSVSPTNNNGKDLNLVI
jgi:hypothetical protein